MYIVGFSHDTLETLDGSGPGLRSTSRFDLALENLGSQFYWPENWSEPTTRSPEWQRKNADGGILMRSRDLTKRD